MDIDSFRRAADAAHLGFATLHQRALDAPDPSHAQELMREAVEELQTSMEELRVAGEELDRQNDELIASRLSLAAAEQRYRGLFDSAPDAYLVTDAAGTVLEANQMAYSLFSAPSPYMLHKPLVVFVTPQDRRDFRNNLRQLLASGAHPKWETRMVAYRKARTFDAAITLTVLRDAWSRMESLLWLVRDVTERKRAEEEVRRLNEELEEKVRARTSALERLLEEQEEFERVLSHDLRSPLTAIQGFAQMLEKNPERTESVRTAGAAINMSAHRMDHMISELADAGRISAGKLELRSRAVDLGPFAREMVDRLQLAVGDNRLRLEVPDGLPPVQADPYHLERILTNLITNALKYSDGQVEVLARTEGAEVVVSVADHGVGIAVEELPRIFGRYYRGRATASKDGLGLGLYITKGLVEAHGGRIWVESRVGVGSTFGFRLPASHG